MAGNCSGIKLNRNAQGFAAAAGAGQVGSCGQKPLRYAPDNMSGTTQAVDNLIVRNRLMTNTQLGGTLTLQGSGLPDPMFEAALCVKAGANIQGLSQHGLLRVVGDSFMGGPVAMTQCYGPLKVSNSPDAVPVGEVLTVVGGASSITFSALSVRTDQVEAGLLLTDDLLVNKEFKVNGYLAGPLATAELTKLTSTWNVTVKTASGATTHAVLGVAVSARTLIMPYVLNAATGTTLDTVGLDPLTVTVQLSNGAFRALKATVLRKMPTGNAALVGVDPGQSFVFETFAELASYADDADTPSPGSAVLVITGDNNAAMGGTRTAVSGYVSEPSGQMFQEYTSVHVVLPTLQTQALTGATLTNGATGGAVYDYRGRLLAMVQYGTPNSVPPSGSTLFQTIVGGVKARYLSLLTDAGITPTVTFPVGTLSVRGIGTLERTVGLQVGGVTSAAVGATTVLSNQLMTYASAAVPTVFMGSKGANTPSFQDSVLRSYKDGNVAATVVAADLGTVYNYVDGAVFDVGLTKWNKGPPITSSPFCGSTNASTDFVKAKTGTITRVFLNTGAPTVPSALPAVVMTHGYQTTDATDVKFIVAWGNRDQLNTWFQGIGGYIRASWDAKYPFAPPNGNDIFVVAGVFPTGWNTKFFADITNSNLFTYNTTYDANYTGNDVTLAVTNVLANSVSYTLSVGPAYNWFAYTGLAANCAWPLKSTGSGYAAVQWTDGTNLPVAIVPVLAAPTPLYT